MRRNLYETINSNQTLIKIPCLTQACPAQGDQREPLIKKYDQRVKDLIKQFFIYVADNGSVVLTAENWVEVYEGKWSKKKTKRKRRSSKKGQNDK